MEREGKKTKKGKKETDKKTIRVKVKRDLWERHKEVRERGKGQRAKGKGERGKGRKGEREKG
jgi:hypothetical protein